MIDRDAFDRYDRALSTNADLVAAAVASLEKEMGGLTFDEMAAALESRYRALVTEYGTYAAAVAVEFYAQQREASRPATDYEAVQCYPKDWALLADDVRTEAVRGREVAEVLRSLAGRSQQRVMAYADETVDRNAALDPAHPKWAIVPHPGACAWCVTLGSFGFAYGSESTATNARHPWCKCTPAPDFDREKPYLSGYNPEEMYDAYRMCQDTVRDDAERRWAAMSEEERSRYTSAGRVHKDGTRGPRRVDYQAYLKRRTVEEMGRRDRGWLQGGKVSTDYTANPMSRYGRLIVPGDYSPGNIIDRGNEWRDLWAHHVLEQNGIRAETHGSADLDLTIDGVWWEVKSPETSAGGVRPGNELDFIEKNLRRASHQFRDRGLGSARVVLNLRYRHAASDDVLIGETKRRMAMHDVAEVLFIKSDGSLERLYK